MWSLESYNHINWECSDNKSYLSIDGKEKVLVYLLTYLKPVNGTTVNERRKLSQPVPEGISYRTEGYYDV